MSMTMGDKYEVYKGAEKITPADDVQQIYGGSQLLWERTKQITTFFKIEKIFESAELENHCFTKLGLIVPASISYNSPINRFYKLTGEYFEEDFSNIVQVYEEDGLELHKDLEYVHGDDAFYNIRVKNSAGQSLSKDDGGYVKNVGKAFVKGDISGNFISRTLWSGTSYFPARAYNGGGGGIYPALPYYGYLTENGSRAKASCISDNSLITDKDYVILSSYKGGYIAHKNNYVIDMDENFNEISKIVSKSIGSVFSSTGFTREFHPYKVGDYVFWDSGANNKWTFYKPRSYTQLSFDSASVAYEGGLYFIFNPYKLQPEEERTFYYIENAETGELKEYALTESLTEETFELSRPRTGGGIFYTDEAGAVYVIGKSSRQDENGKDIYALLKITRNK